MSLETAKATEQSECGGRRAVSATGCLHGPRRTREPLLSPSEILCHRGRVALFPLIERFPWGRKNYRMLLTNSTLVADNRAVQRTFVPPFLQSPKTLAMVAGHVHSYERYTRSGKTFLVTGGGGPRMRLATGRRRRHGDDCFAGPPLRGFPFLLLRLGT